MRTRQDLPTETRGGEPVIFSLATRLLLHHRALFQGRFLALFPSLPQVLLLARMARMARLALFH